MAELHVARDVLAALFGCDVRTITNLANEGMPKLARGRFDLAACVPWYLNREREAARAGKGLNDLDLARQRKTIASARREEMALAEDEKRLITSELHEERLSERLETVAGAVKAISRYHKDVKAAVTDVAADQLLDRMADEMLAELYGLADSID